MTALAVNATEQGALFSMAPGAWFDEVRRGLAGRKLAPYLGPGLIGVANGAQVPASYGALAGFFASQVSLPKRARGNAWASAQFIESRKHRSSVDQLMRRAFSAPPVPLEFHRFLASLELPLLIDTWYDGALRAALAERGAWVEAQGINRAPIGEVGWYRAYGPAGEKLPITALEGARTLLYTPHGSSSPVGNFLITDSDYVEVLTEIDIQTPIPESVRTRRAELGFVFIGCRFDDQLLRTYARQITKRSRGQNYVLFDSPQLTRMEQRFVRELGLLAIVCPLSEALSRLSG